MLVLSAQVPYEVSTPLGPDTVYQLRDDYLMPELFSNLEGEYNDMQQIRNAPRTDRDSSRLYLLLFAMLIGLAFLRTQFERELRSFWRSLTNLNIAQQAYREEDLTRTPQNLLMQFLFLLSFSLWITLVAASFGRPLVPDNDWLSLGVALLFATVVFVARELLRWFVGTVFRQQGAFGLFRYHIHILNGLAGIVLVPLLFLQAFSVSDISHIAAIIVAIVLGIFYLWRSFKGIQLGMGGSGSGRLHFILYICTLEIAPALVLFRFISDWFTGS